MYPLQTTPLLLALVLIVGPASGQSLDGRWVVDPERSVDFDPWRSFTVTIASMDSTVTVERFWRAGRYSQRDSMTVPMDREVTIPIRPGKWMDQVYLGVFVPEDTTRSVLVSRSKDGRTLTVKSDVPLETSQTDVSVTIVRRFELSEDASEMVLIETRSSRESDSPLRYVFKRE